MVIPHNKPLPVIRIGIIALMIVGVLILMVGGRFVTIPIGTSGETSMPPDPPGPNDPCRVADGALVIADIITIVSQPGGSVAMNATFSRSQTIIRNIGDEIWVAHAYLGRHVADPIRSGKMSITKFLSAAESIPGSWAPGKIARILGFRAEAMINPTIHTSLEEMHQAMGWNGKGCGQ